MRGGVEVHRADAAFTADGATFDAGSWIVRLDQPFRPFAKDLLEPQRYPDLRASPGGPPIAAVRHGRLDAGVPDGRAGDSRRARPRRADDEAGGVPGRRGAHSRGPRQGRSCFGRLGTNASPRIYPPLYILDPATNQFVPRASTRCWRPAFPCRAPRTRVRLPTRRDGPGRVRRHGQARGRSGSRGDDGVEQHGVTAGSRHASADGDACRRFMPRASGSTSSWIANIDEGWTRWVLEQYRLPVHDGHERGRPGPAISRERFDVVILPSQSPRAILEGHRPDGPRSRERAVEPRAAGVPRRHWRRRRGRR